MLSPEARLVFRHADPACSTSEYVELARAVTDWLRTFGIAEREMASASLYRALNAAQVPLPPDAREAFARSTMMSELRSQHLARRLRDTTRVFGDRAIPCLLLKGAAVGALLDPTFRARPMSDVDLLVHPPDTERASEAVVASGWPMTTDPVLLELLKDHHHLPHFLDPNVPGIRLELHTRIWPRHHPFAFDEAHLWRDARPAPPPFDGASVPSPEHLLLHTCVHFAWQHTMRFGAWRTFRSIAAAIAAPDFSWSSFESTIRAARAASAAYWSLRLASHLGGLKIPADVLARLAPPGLEPWKAALERHFVIGLVQGEGIQSPSIRLTHWLWKSAIRPAWSGHVGASPWESDEHWLQTAGFTHDESRWAQLSRQLASYQQWWRFAAQLFRR